jgi:hypothetical protein
MRGLVAIFWGGLVAGTLDILFAFLTFWMRGISPPNILRAIASGLLGRAAFEGGAVTAALGAFLHYFIAFSAAAFFWVAASRIPMLLRQAVLAGITYGMAFYLLMRWIVVPLSAVSNPGLSLEWSGVFAHTVLFGLPIALIARWAARTAPAQPAQNMEVSR